MKISPRFLLLSISLVTPTSGWAQPTFIPLLGAELYPEGIAVDRRDGHVYVGSSGDGSIQVIVKGKAQLFQPAGTDGRDGALGVKIDEKSDRLAVAAGDAVYLYRLSTNQLIRKALITEALSVSRSALNDMAFDRNSNLYITDSFNPYIFRLDGLSLELKIFADLQGKVPYGRQNDFPYNLNGIVLTPDGRSLLSVKTNDGTLWKIDLLTKAVSEVPLSEAVTKGDGLVWGRGDRLFIIRNFENKVSSIDYRLPNVDGSYQVATFSSGGLKIPTTAVYLPFPKPHLTVVNSQFGIDPPVLPFSLVKIPIQDLTISPLR